MAVYSIVATGVSDRVSNSGAAWGDGVAVVTRSELQPITTAATIAVAVITGDHALPLWTADKCAGPFVRFFHDAIFTRKLKAMSGLSTLPSLARL